MTRIASGFADDDGPHYNRGRLAWQIMQLKTELASVRRTANRAWWLALLTALCTVIYRLYHNR